MTLGLPLEQEDPSRAGAGAQQDYFVLPTQVPEQLPPQMQETVKRKGGGFTFPGVLESEPNSVYF
ncbi:MAG: hypothetical protein Q8K18_01130 [Burkholderiales bacterium]|nr:hypothetical protein [Burkholderiales bacterium]